MWPAATGSGLKKALLRCLLLTRQTLQILHSQGLHLSGARHAYGQYALLAISPLLPVLRVNLRTERVLNSRTWRQRIVRTRRLIKGRRSSILPFEIHSASTLTSIKARLTPVRLDENSIVFGVGHS